MNKIYLYYTLHKNIEFFIFFLIKNKLQLIVLNDTNECQKVHMKNIKWE